MSYCLVINATIDAEQGGLPASARRLDTREWVMGLATASVELQQACGWFLVTETPRPADTATTTFDDDVQWDGTQAIRVWTERPFTTDELAAQTQQTNRTTIEAAMDAALAQLTTYINAPAPTFTNLAAAQTWARQIQTAFQQVCVYERQEIRYLRGDFDGSS